MKRPTNRFAILTVVLASAVSARGEEIPTELLARYVNNDTLVVATARIEPELLAQLLALAETQMTTPHDQRMIERLKPMFEAWGDRRLYAIASANDALPVSNGPLLIVTAATGEDSESLPAFGEKLRNEYLNGAHVRLVDGKALLVANRAGLDRFDAIKPQPRPELIETLANLVKDEAAVAAVLADGPDARRVLREMWPQLPPPASDITGPLLADRVRNVTFAAKFPPQWSAELAIHTSDEQTAATIAHAGEKLIQQFAPLIQQEARMPGIDWPAMFELATPKQDGTTVKLTVTHDNAAVAKAIAGLTAKALNDARAAARRSQRVNNLKQLGLAFHNFHETQKHFPASAAICDKDGKPLLSWRVAILPFIEQQALFNQFHLDEPWDSEHNRKLITTMPSLYVDPAQRDPGGKTTFLVPVHKETVFPPPMQGKVATKKFGNRELFLAEGTDFRKITDGTSQTILLVEVAPGSAVPWTKPADWEVDLANPTNGLKQDGRDGFMAGFCDGSVRYIGFDAPVENLRAWLTRAGQEVVKQ